MSRSDTSRSEFRPRRRLGARLWRARSGAVVVEAALLLPLIAIGVAAFVDVSLYYRTAARADRVATGLGDLVSRAESIRDRPEFGPTSASDDLGVFFEMARIMAEPADLRAQGGVVISSLTGTGTGAIVNWQRASGPGAAASAARVLGVGPLPAGMPFVVAEVFLPFEPVILGRDDLLGPVGFDRVIYRRAVWRPRSAALTRLEPAP